MPRLRPRASCILAAAVISVAITSPALSPRPAAQGATASELRVAHRARALQPGEVVLLVVESRKPLKELRGEAFARPFSLFSDQDSMKWQGLIGIDPEIKAGRFSIELRGRGLDGTLFQAAHELEVRSRQFPTRRLTVDEQFVTPPKEAEERIRLEAKRVEDIFAAFSPKRMWQGAFAVPVPGQASSSFGRRTILNGKPRSPHWGTDFAADAGTPVTAPNSGKVVLAADLYFSGKTVIIDHGMGLYSLLAHLSQSSVRDGDEIRGGATVGLAGATGRATGPHLHWSVRLAGVRVDPQSLIAALGAD